MVTKKGARLVLASFVVVVVDELLEFFAIILSEVVLCVVLILVVEEVREDVSHGLSFRVALGEDCRKCALGQQLMGEVMPLAVSIDDTIHLPKVDVVEKFTAWNSYFAHE